MVRLHFEIYALSYSDKLSVYEKIYKVKISEWDDVIMRLSLMRRDLDIEIKYKTQL